MKDHKAVAKTIKSMLIDINAEVIVADLIESGFDFDKILVRHDGLFKRNFSKDISDVYYDMVKELLTLHISHDSFYDILPDGLFHDIFSDFNPENRRLEFEKLKKQEKNARKFFIPFDYEFFIQYVKLEIALREYFNKPENFIHRLLLFEQSAANNYMDKLSSYLLFVDKVIGNSEITALCLSDILGHSVEVSANYENENLGYNNSENLHLKRGNILGDNYICGNSVDEGREVWKFSISISDDKSVENYIEFENKQISRVLEVFCEYFIPIEIEVKTNIVCDNTAQFVIGKDKIQEAVETANNYLGFNTVI